MGQIQNAITSAVGSVAVGAIANKNMTEIKKDLAKQKVETAGAQEEAAFYADYAARGIDPETDLPYANYSIPKAEIATKSVQQQTKSKSQQNKNKRQRFKIKKGKLRRL